MNKVTFETADFKVTVEYEQMTLKVSELIAHLINDCEVQSVTATDGDNPSVTVGKPPTVT